MNLQKIDGLYLPSHYYLDKDDDCYFLMTYAVGKGFGYSKHNQLIWNLKKPMDRKDTSEWVYKEKAIVRSARMLEEANIVDVFPPDSVYIPVPPSKVKGDPDYDNRLSQILTKAYGGKLDVRELVEQVENTESYHVSGKKRDIDEIFGNLSVDNNLADGIKGDIVIFDDVLTSGAHFKAMSRLLSDRFKDVNIHGLFLARAQQPDDFEDVNLEEF